MKSPFLGGAFGSKGFLWQHVALAAQAARTCGRPVKLMLTREQMFTSTGHRPRTIQRLTLDAEEQGALTTVEHRTMTETSPVAHFVEPAGMDPLAFRLRNYAAIDLQDNRPWSSKHLRECYRQGAERFGWATRAKEPRATERGNKLVGWGMATAAYPARRSPATVRAVLTRDGVATFSTATEENGGGTATAMAQIAVDALGLPRERVRFAWGDSAMTEAPVVGASQTAATIGPAVEVAACKLRERCSGWW